MHAHAHTDTPFLSFPLLSFPSLSFPLLSFPLLCFPFLQPKASGLLRAHLIQAKGLRTHGLSAIFVTFELGGVLKRSRVMGSACNVTFDDEEIVNLVVQVR